MAAAAVAVLAVANLPVLTGHRLVDPAIDRDQDPPAAWRDAAAALDAGDTGARVLQLPGQEFGAFRWGYTVDPPLPGHDRQAARHPRPAAARQRGGDGPAVRARRPLPVRHRRARRRSPRSPACSAPTRSGSPATPPSTASARRRPELVADLFAAGVAGRRYTDAVRRAGRQRARHPDGRRAVGVRPPGRPGRPARRAGAGRGSGAEWCGPRTTSCSSPAAATASSTPPRPGCSTVTSWSATPDRCAATSSRRRRRAPPRSSSPTPTVPAPTTGAARRTSSGFTEDDEPGEPDVLRARPGRRAPARVRRRRRAAPTVAVQEGPVRARATAYGEPFAYRPEDRAVMAVDGDPATAWRVGRSQRPDRRAARARRRRADRPPHAASSPTERRRCATSAG